MSNFAVAWGQTAPDGRDPFVRALALLPSIGMLRLTGLLLGLPLEPLDIR